MYYAQLYTLDREYIKPKRSEFGYYASIRSCFIELYEELALRGINISNLPDISEDYPRGKDPVILDEIKLKLENLLAKPNKSVSLHSKDILKEILFLISNL